MYRTIYKADCARIARADFGASVKCLTNNLYLNHRIAVNTSSLFTITYYFQKSGSEKLLGAMIDRFGENIEFTAKENGKLMFSAQVQISPQFFGWCISFGDLLKVTNPTHIFDKIYDNLSKVLTLYTLAN